MDDIDGAGWRTSSYTGTNGNCVEVGDTTHIVLVRDTKDRAGVVLRVPAGAWENFTAALR